MELCFPTPARRARRQVPKPQSAPRMPKLPPWPSLNPQSSNAAARQPIPCIRPVLPTPWQLTTHGALTARATRRYITPPGTGFLPRETAVHHQQHVVGLVQEALKLANLQPADIDAIAFTKVCPLRQRAPEPCHHFETQVEFMPSLRAASRVAIASQFEKMSVMTGAACAGAGHGRPAAELRRLRAHASAHVEGANRRSEPLRWCAPCRPFRLMTPTTRSCICTPALCTCRRGPLHRCVAGLPPMHCAAGGVSQPAPTPLLQGSPGKP